MCILYESNTHCQFYIVQGLFLPVASLEEVIWYAHELNLIGFHVFFVKKACRGIDDALLVELFGNNPFSSLKMKRHPGQCLIVLFVNQINRLIAEIARKEPFLVYLFIVIRVFARAEIIHIPCKGLVIRQFAFLQCFCIQRLSGSQILKSAVISVFLNRPLSPIFAIRLPKRVFFCIACRESIDL